MLRKSFLTQSIKSTLNLQFYLMSESEPTIVEENQTISVSIQAIVDEEKGDGADMLDLIQNELNSRKKLKYRMEIPENPQFQFSRKNIAN